ncbi:MAG: cytochrome-c oxidase, cbb3-type subunit III [Burkholderiales bacterium]|nr:cytochrome-c oxidase, cbb3-type subunit III [Burkholderiales bacterium]
MSAFWSSWVIVLIVLNLGISLLLFLWAPRAKVPTQADGTTGHVWAHGALREGMHRLPRWWIAISAASFAAAFGYLALYPGFGNSSGRLGWTSHGELARDTAANDRLLDSLAQRISQQPIETLARDPQVIAMGKVLFADNCAGCHGSNARGNYLLGAPSLADDDWLYGGDAKTILTSILDGRQGAMPPWIEVLGAAGVQNVAAYVRSLSGSKPHDATSALRVSAGKAQFAPCAACHGPDGKGNPALGAPDLTDSIWIYGGSAAAVQESIRNGRNGKMPAWRDRLGERDARVLAAYVYSFSHGNAQPYD